MKKPRGPESETICFWRIRFAAKNLNRSTRKGNPFLLDERRGSAVRSSPRSIDQLPLRICIVDKDILEDLGTFRLQSICRSSLLTTIFKLAENLKLHLSASECHHRGYHRNTVNATLLRQEIVTDVHAMHCKPAPWLDPPTRSYTSQYNAGTSSPHSSPARSTWQPASPHPAPHQA